MITDANMYPTDDTMEVPVPPEVLVAAGLARAISLGTVRVESSTAQANPLELTLGGHSLGSWLIDGIQLRWTRTGGQYVATIRKVVER